MAGRGTAGDPTLTLASKSQRSMTSTLFILNDAPYGNERAYNGLRLAGALAAKEDQSVRLFLMADAVGCAKSGQKVPEMSRLHALGHPLPGRV